MLNSQLQSHESGCVDGIAIGYIIVPKFRYNMNDELEFCSLTWRTRYIVAPTYIVLLLLHQLAYF